MAGFDAYLLILRSPSYGNRAEHCFLTYKRFVRVLIVDWSTRFVRNKSIDAHLAFGLVAIGCEPAYSQSLINDKHIVISVGIERESHILWTVEHIIIRVVACSIKVVIAKPVFCTGCEIEGHSIGHHERIVHIAIHIKALQLASFDIASVLDIR